MFGNYAPALFKYCRPTCTMYSAIDPTSSHQSGVSGVDDRVSSVESKVALFNNDCPAINVQHHSAPPKGG